MFNGLSVLQFSLLGVVFFVFPCVRIVPSSCRGRFGRRSLFSIFLSISTCIYFPTLSFRSVLLSPFEPVAPRLQAQTASPLVLTPRSPLLLPKNTPATLTAARPRAVPPDLVQFFSSLLSPQLLMLSQCSASGMHFPFLHVKDVTSEQFAARVT
jgi:hypothetical protein